MVHCVTLNLAPLIYINLLIHIKKSVRELIYSATDTAGFAALRTAFGL